MKIYLSSTLKDLLAERAAVKEALAGQHVVRDSYNANESDVRTSCIEDVRASDVYVGIVGLRYGFRPEGRAKSITELEFDAATDAGIPRLIFIKDEAEIAFGFTDADEPWGLTRIRNWRQDLQRVISGGVRPAIFKTAHELTRLLLKSVNELELPPAESDGQVFDSVQRIWDRPQDSTDRSFQVTALHRRVIVQRPHAELTLHEELINVSTLPRDEHVGFFVSDTPIEFKDFAATVRLTIGDESFSGAISATQPKRDGRSFKVRVGFKGRTVPPGKTVTLDWFSRFPGSVGRNEDYWVFPCPDDRPIRDLICEVVFPAELVDYRFFRVERDGRREPLAMTAGMLDEDPKRYIYRAVQHDTAGLYLMTWRLE